MKALKILTLLLLIGAMTCHADTISKTYYFDEPNLVPAENFTKLQVKDAVSLGNPGDPAIPYIGIRLLLPQNESIVSVSLALKDEVNLGNYILYPKQQQVPLSKIEGAKFTEPNPEIYQSEIQFPSRQYTNYSTHYLAGYSLGFLALTPIKYIPATGELSYYKEIVVSVETEYNEAAESSGRFLFKNPQVEKRLQKLVDNPEQIDNYIITKTRDDDAYDYLIVTSADYADDFQPLVDFHSHRGYRTKIELVSDIYTNYTGVDEQDKIRNYFIDQYSNGPIKFVLLGGDTAPNNPSDNIIPHRGLFSNPSGYTEYDIPADMYYACLDRTSAPGSGPDWNNDNDNRWGEPNEADLLAEFYIGRICMNNPTEISNAINKMMLYSETPVADEVQTALLVGEYLWGPPYYPTTYGGTYMNELIGGCSNNGYTTVGIPADWDISTLYEMDGNWTSSDLYTQLNLGPNLLCHLGHGNPTHCLNIDNSDLTTYHITNDGIIHNFINGYSQACYSGSMDNWHFDGYYGPDCFAEKISTMPTATSTFIANSRYGWGEAGGTDGASQIFNREWFDAFFDDGVYSIGGANQVSKEHAIPFIEAQQVVRWCCYELNVFGDPSLELWTEAPTNLSATYPQTIMAGTPEIDVIAPAFSRITVYDDDTIYGYGITNFLGEGTVVLDIIPQEAGIMHISIVAHNYYKYVGDITVTASVVTLYPDTINVNVPTQVTVEVMAPDSVSPQVGVNVWAEGLDYISATEVTNATGTSILNLNYSYGPILMIYGQNPGDEYFLFIEELNVTALDLTNPSLNVTTDFGLEDTFALNLEGTIEAYADENDFTLWVNVDGTGFNAAADITCDVTPTTMIPVDAIIAKSGYDLYEEIFPVIVAYGTVSGIVTESQNGAPVTNAEVCFYEQGANPNTDDPVFVATTNASGLYASEEGNPVEYYDIYINKWGYDPYQEFNYFLGYGSNAHDIVLDPVESGFISGNVFNDFMMIDNATLSYLRSDNGEEYASVQSSIGSYEVSLPNFTYHLYVTAEGHVPYVGTLIVNGDAQYDYHLGFAKLFDDAEDGTAQWTSADWGATEEDCVSPTHSFTDSPGGSYPSWTTAILQLTNPINLSSLEGSASLYFNVKWDIEPNWDYAQVQASTDGTTWTALEGEYTEPGTGSYQPTGEPLYDGTQVDWVAETSDLSDFAGEDQVYIRFLMASDGNVEEDGIHVDDILIGDPASSYEIPTFSNDDPYTINQFRLNQNFPNPATGSTTISFSLPANTQNATLKIYNIKGQLVKTFIPETSPVGTAIDFVWDGKDNHDKTVSNGVYFYRLETNEKQVTKKMVLMK